MGPVQQYVDEKPLDPLTVELYAPGEAGAFTIYDPEHPEIKIQYRLQPGALEIQISPTAGQVELALYGITVKNAEVNGVTYEIKRREKGQLIRFDGRAGSQVLFRL